MKHTASKPVRGVEMFAEISAFILLGWLCTFLFPVVYVWLQSGHLPVFGGDADLSGRPVLLNIIFGINLLFLFAGLPAAAALILILIHLVVNRYAFTRSEIILYLSAALSLVLFFVFRDILTPQFDWFYD